jgi:phosphotriesterase-related protein
MVHLPFRQFGHEVLDIVLDEFGVEPRAVVLAHMDWGDNDPDYQRSLAERGVVLEFDMIGMPFLYPMEGQSPTPGQTAEAIARLVDAGHGDRILLSHDLFLKTMMRKHGGNGLVYVPTLFAGRLRAAGVDPAVVQAMMTANPRALFEHAAG